jgi:hypothetical protein
MMSTVTLEYIDELLAYPSEQPIKLWTTQHRCAVQTLQAGQHVGRREYVRGKNEDEDARCRKLMAYKWMVAQMRKWGLSVEADAVPIWTFLSPPLSRSDWRWEDRPDDKLLIIQVPIGRTLISFHQPWEKFLNYAYDPARKYLIANAEDAKTKDCQERNLSDCEKSWEKMFCLTLARSSGFRWSLILQAALPVLYESDVCEIQDDW